VKSFFRRKRPEWLSETPRPHRLRRPRSSSFPSGHASAAFTAATILSEDDPLWPGEKLLGKKPEILLHRSSNWKKGSNTGTLGLEFAGDGQIIERPAGQFVPTAKIEQYKPDPKLEEESTA